MWSLLTCGCDVKDVSNSNTTFRRMVEGSKVVSKDLRRALKHGKLLGRGLTASVFRVKMNGEIFALKRIDKHVRLTKSVKKALQHEVSILRHLQRVRSGHRHLCNFFQVYEDASNLYVIVLFSFRKSNSADEYTTHNTGT